MNNQTHWLGALLGSFILIWYRRHIRCGALIDRAAEKVTAPIDLASRWLLMKQEIAG
jgi:hypothetical protein